MPDKIKYDELFEASLKAQIDALNKSIVQLGVDMQSTFKIATDSSKKLSEQIQLQNKAEKENATALKTKIKLETDLAKKEIVLQKVIQSKVKTEKDELLLKNKKEVLERKEIRTKQQLNSLYSRESARLNDLRKKFKDLYLAEGKSTNQTRKLHKEITLLDTKLKKVDASVGQFQRNVGNYSSAFSGLNKVLGAAGLTLGLSGVFRLITSVTKVFSEFEKANSTLKAVLGATKKEMELLKKSAKDLGSTTAFTASQVVQLQTEFAKLGFPTNDILLMTESTLNAAAAMGSDLGEQAKLTGATLKAFGLSANETQRVNDALALSTTKSALDFSKLSTSMSTVAPVAKSFGFELEDTLSLLGQLSNAGFDASSAATATRNILLNLADSSSNLGKRLKEPVKDIPSLVNGLNQLKSEGIDLGEALELTDKRSVAAFSTFLEGSDDVLELKNALDDASGSAKKMAETMLDNLEGDKLILTSAWEGFILSVEDGEGIINKAFRSITQKLTEALTTLTEFSKLTELGFSGFVDSKVIEEYTDRYDKYINKQVESKESDEEKIIELERLNDVYSDSIDLEDKRILQLEDQIRKNKRLGGSFEDNNEELEKTLNQSKIKSTVYKTNIQLIDSLKTAINQENEIIEDNTKTTEINNTTKKDPVKTNNELLESYEDLVDAEIKAMDAENEYWNEVAAQKKKDLQEQYEYELQIANDLALRKYELNKKAEEDAKIEAENRKLFLDNLLEIGLLSIDAAKDIASGIVDAYIEGYDKEIEASKKKQDELQTLIEEEQDKKDKGAANSIKSLKKQLADEKKLEQKATEDKRKAQRTQQIINDAAQISEIVTATAKIFNSQASLGPVGVVSAITSIATMIGSFIATKIQAQKAVKLVEGTEFVERGNNKKGIDTIPAWLTEGERVVDGETNSQLGNIPNKDLPKYVKAGAMYLNGIQNTPIASMYVNDYSKLESLQKESLQEQKGTNELLGKFIFVSEDGKKIIDINGNKKIYV